MIKLTRYGSLEKQISVSANDEEGSGLREVNAF